MNSTNQTLDVQTLIKYLGVPIVHPQQYWAKMWRLKEGKGGSHIVIKCPKPDYCILHYTDKEGIEHRDALFNISQLPVEYRKQIAGHDSLVNNLNSLTKLTFENVAALYGEPIVDPDIPFIYKWERGDYELVLIGRIFSFSQKNQDDRSTVSLFGQLPPDFRHALNTQHNQESLRQVPIDAIDPKTALIETESSRKANDMNQGSLPDAEYTENSSVIETRKNEEPSPDKILDLTDAEFNLEDTLAQMGVNTRRNTEDDDYPDDDDSFKSSLTKEREAQGEKPIAISDSIKPKELEKSSNYSDRKNMVKKDKSDKNSKSALKEKYQAQLDSIGEFHETQPYKDIDKSKLTPEQKSSQRSFWGRKSAHKGKISRIKKKLQELE